MPNRLSGKKFLGNFWDFSLEFSGIPRIFWEFPEFLIFPESFSRRFFALKNFPKFELFFWENIGQAHPPPLGPHFDL